MMIIMLEMVYGELGYLFLTLGTRCLSVFNKDHLTGNGLNCELMIEYVSL